MAQTSDSYPGLCEDVGWTLVVWAKVNWKGKCPPPLEAACLILIIPRPKGRQDWADCNGNCHVACSLDVMARVEAGLLNSNYSAQEKDDTTRQYYPQWVEAVVEYPIRSPGIHPREGPKIFYFETTPVLPLGAQDSVLCDKDTTATTARKARPAGRSAKEGGRPSSSTLLLETGLVPLWSVVVWPLARASRFHRAGVNPSRVVECVRCRAEAST